MNAVDRAILLFLNSFAHRSPATDTFVSLLSENMLLKGAVFVFLFWWLWFRRDPHQEEHRQFLLLGTVAPIIAVLVARIVAHALPFRERPLREAALHFVVPYGLNPDALQGWSSFPSDHAAFFFAFSVVLLFVSRRAGLFSIAYSVALICLPRVYLGIHYPTDLVAGALIGTAIACLTLVAPLRRSTTRPMLRYMDVNPSLFYGCLALLSYLIGTVCDPVPELIRFSVGILSLWMTRLGHPLQPELGKQSMVEPLITLVAVIAVIAMLSLLRHKVASTRAKQLALRDRMVVGSSAQNVRH